MGRKLVENLLIFVDNQIYQKSCNHLIYKGFKQKKHSKRVLFVVPPGLEPGTT